MSMQTRWPPGWHAVDPPQAIGLANRLELELMPGHELHGGRYEAVAVCDRNDDVLFRRLDASDRYVVVHLTWTSNRDPAFPGVEHEGTLAEFMDWANR